MGAKPVDFNPFAPKTGTQPSSLDAFLGQQQPNAAASAAGGGGGTAKPVDYNPFSEGPAPNAAPADTTDANAKVNAFTGGALDLPILGPAIKGGAQRAAAGIRSLMYGTPYDQELQAVQNYAQNAEEQNPGTNLAGQVAGSLGAFGGLGATATGAKLLGTAADMTIPQMLLRGGGSGALINAADAAIRGGDPVKAGAIGGLLGVGGNAAGKVIGDAISSAATSGAKTAAPKLTPQILKDASTPVYKESVATGNTIKLPTAEDAAGGNANLRDYANSFFKGGETPKIVGSPDGTGIVPPGPKVTQTNYQPQPQTAEDIAQSIRDNLHPLKLREANAGRTYRELSRLEGAQDLNDVAIARDKMRDIANGISQNKLIKVTGEDSKAARAAMNQLDTQMETLSPGWVEKNRIADANWAAARRAEEVMKAADKGTLGSFVKNETKTKGFTPEEITAVKTAHTGGPSGILLNGLGALSPFHGGLTGTIGKLMTIPNAIATGGTSLYAIPAGIVADRAAQNIRKKALDTAVQKILSRSPVGAAAMPPPVIRPPAAPMPNTLGLMLRGSVNPLLQSQ